jgi:hypothetical protein
LIVRSIWCSLTARKYSIDPQFQRKLCQHVQKANKSLHFTHSWIIDRTGQLPSSSTISSTKLHQEHEQRRDGCATRTRTRTRTLTLTLALQRCPACRAFVFAAKVTAQATGVCDPFSCQRVLGCLQAKFSTGVSLAELRSIGLLAAQFGGLSPPSRESKRCYRHMVEWFVVNWAGVAPWLNFIQLRDSQSHPIDRTREMADRGIT